MLTPSLIAPIKPLYAIGNTPAVSLTRCLPQGVDADILLLGCGDVRHILYTAYAEQGFREFLPFHSAVKGSPVLTDAYSSPQDRRHLL